MKNLILALAAVGMFTLGMATNTAEARGRVVVRSGPARVNAYYRGYNRGYRTGYRAPGYYNRGYYGYPGYYGGYNRGYYNRGYGYGYGGPGIYFRF